MMSTVPIARIVHLHIPKTAGTALRTAFEKTANGSLRISPHFQEAKYADLDPSEFDFFSGHFGFKTAAKLDGKIITVVRNPLDRFVSLYYFLRQQFDQGREKGQRATLASRYSLSEFVKIRDEPSLLEPFYNTMTWQIACGAPLAQRRELRLVGKTDDDILQLALANLATFSLVGVQEKLELFADALAKKFSVELKIKKVNVTTARPDAKDIGAATTNAIRDWTFMDHALYEHADKLVSQSTPELERA
jgi:hypothetical protein